MSKNTLPEIIPVKREGEVKTLHRAYLSMPLEEAMRHFEKTVGRRPKRVYQNISEPGYLRWYIPVEDEKNE